MVMSRVIKYLLRNHKEVTVAALIGIMLGSMRIPMDKILGVDLISLIICIIIALIGMAIILYVETKFQYELISTEENNESSKRTLQQSRK